MPDIVAAIPPIARHRSIASRCGALRSWYAQYGRHALPWRLTRDPYAILVSEVMLQQTQVDRVRSYWGAWMQRWPTAQALARARRGSVMRAWAGLGYNRRAVYLHQFAQRVAGDVSWGEIFSYSYELASGSGSVEEWWDVVGRVRVLADGNGGGGRRAQKWSPSPAVLVEEGARTLEMLPGIGPYTSRALLAFAWNAPAPCVDTNIRRVLAHVIYRRPAIMELPIAQIQKLAARVIPPDGGRTWNYALMDYGALVLPARRVPNQIKRVVVPFKNSSRYWRGRIVDVLRDHHRPLPPAVLRERLGVFGECTEDIDALLASLIRDGIVALRGSGVRLA
ncbi:hypothetical protein HY632_03445 [Candidatus Uhrbacteria bacterium]|nr:hypothetical protein [Candidatus Uhrbacteria bacterium]